LDPPPFNRVFDASTIVPGQNVTATFHVTDLQPAPIYTPLTTVTLTPQMINGTIRSITTSGAFTVYTLTLAPYDLFPAMAVLPAQANQIASPNTIQVYVDPHATLSTTSPPAVGGTLRCFGLVYDDAAVLKMDASQVLDGVPL
jgi:hypothetical protein